MAGPVRGQSCQRQQVSTGPVLWPTNNASTSIASPLTQPADRCVHLHLATCTYVRYVGGSLSLAHLVDDECSALLSGPLLDRA